MKNNPWIKFNSHLRKRISLEKFGLPEMWVEIAPLVAYPQRIITRMTNENPDDAMPMYKLCITNWNLTDMETDEPLPLPKDNTDKENTFMDILPPMIIAWIADEIRKYNDESLPPSLMRERTTS
jgi:hypothetical protein